MSTPGSSRRRRAERIPVSLAAELQGRGTVPIVVVDISLSGALVRVPRAVDPGSIFDLHLPLPSGNLRGKVRVADCSRDGNSGEETPVWLSGIEFLAFAVEDRERLRQYLEGARRRPGADPPSR